MVSEDVIGRIQRVLESSRGVTVFMRGRTPLAERPSLLFVAAAALAIMRDKPVFTGFCVGTGGGRYRLDGVSNPTLLEPLMNEAAKQLAGRSILLSMHAAGQTKNLREAVGRWSKLSSVIKREGEAGVNRWRQALAGQFGRPGELVAGWLSRVGGSVALPGSTGQSMLASGPILLTGTDGVLQRHGRGTVLHAPLPALMAFEPGQLCEVRYQRGTVIDVRQRDTGLAIGPSEKLPAGMKR